MEMKGDKSHDTDHWVKQEQNHGAVYFGRARLDKRRLKPARFPLQTSNKLSQRGRQSENSISSHLCHLVSTNYAVLLFCRSEITAPFLTFS